jgi:parallel beta-helix repeat protein
MEDLNRLLDRADFAMFFLRAEDEVTRRGEAHLIARDNVVFELGLFMGRLERERTYAAVERGSGDMKALKVFSDFYGVTYLSYEKLEELAGTVLEQIEKLKLYPRRPKSTHVVDPNGNSRFHHGTITSALEAARTGDAILICPGVYSEQLAITKTVELIGIRAAGEAQRPVLQYKGASTLVYDAPTGQGRVSNLNIEMGGCPDGAAVDVANGFLAIDGCRVTTMGSAQASIRVRGSGRAHVTSCNIVDGGGAGVLVCEHGHAEIVDNLVSRNTHSAIEVRDGTGPRVIANRIGEGRSGGVLVRDDSSPVVQYNDIFENRYAGIAIRNDAVPTIDHNRVHDGHAYGIWVSDDARPTITGNSIYGNSGTGIEIQGGTSFIYDNQLLHGLGGGLQVCPEASGRIEKNEISGNKLAGVVFQADSRPETFISNRVIEGRGEGVRDETNGIWGDNEVHSNALGDWVG